MTSSNETSVGRAPAGGSAGALRPRNARAMVPQPASQMCRERAAFPLLNFGRVSLIQVCLRTQRLSGLIGGSQPSQRPIAGLSAIPPTRAFCPTTRKLNRTFAEVRASRNTIETVSLSRRNNCHANVCAPVELAPSRQATNGQRRYSCRARRSRYTPGLTREREYD
jgi:hypothetical protein